MLADDHRRSPHRLLYKLFNFTTFPNCAHLSWGLSSRQGGSVKSCRVRGDGRALDGAKRGAASDIGHKLKQRAGALSPRRAVEPRAPRRPLHAGRAHGVRSGGTGSPRTHHANCLTPRDSCREWTTTCPGGRPAQPGEPELAPGRINSSAVTGICRGLRVVTRPNLQVSARRFRV